MVKETFKGTIESAYGKPVSPALKFSGEFDAYQNVQEIRDANDYPKDEEIVSFRNTQRKANERQKVMQATLDAAGYVKPTLESDSQLQLKTIIKALVASGKDAATAQQIAETTLGVKLES